MSSGERTELWEVEDADEEGDRVIFESRGGDKGCVDDLECLNGLSSDFAFVSIDVEWRREGEGEGGNSTHHIMTTLSPCHSLFFNFSEVIMEDDTCFSHANEISAVAKTMITDIEIRYVDTTQLLPPSSPLTSSSQPHVRYFRHQD